MERLRAPLGDYVQLLLRHGLLADTRSALPVALLAHPVSLVTCDSRTAITNALFICKGAAFRAAFLHSAMEHGAFAYVSETEYPEVQLPCLRVTDVRAAMGLLADFYYEHPSQKLTVTGITGTKGKTTTAYYLKAILDAYQTERGRGPSAILSSIITDDGVNRRPAKLTTPEPLDLQRHLWNAVSVSADYLTMEVSSQALKYGRVIGVALDCAVFLNIGEDHISPLEHPDLEDYFTSKLRIFRQAAAACVNLDTAQCERVLEAARQAGHIVTFSARQPSADIYASGARKENGRILFHVRTPEYAGELSLPTAGLFNVENALAAIAVSHVYGIPFSAVAAGLRGAVVPGRMEQYESDDGDISVIVDYAHNGMSLEAVLKSLRQEYPDHELTVVFGCTGGKGLDRREGMGNAAGALADRIILTEDDPGPEEVEAICAEIGSYITQHGKTYTVISDRNRAALSAVEGCRKPAVILLAGKGCEQEQKRRDGPVPCVPDGLLAQQVLGRYSTRAIKG
ncbi:MAG: UDP-N-acetylmuramoyl-L-alanyl-D-glutamate--2,6-diaminopimelate ligase [Oscillospiraceae bacterium]|nr:UDP-N-acetylmuramoyl-L-alanyl-D-glutamate--2,6-diaminopimelate ligase [Oscillospiraceae bacterium]